MNENENEVSQAEQPEQTPEQAQVEPERDFGAEVEDLLREFPEAAKAGRLPDEVVQACARDGRSALDAYRDWALTTRAAAFRERSAQRAPVRGVSGGGAVENQGKDAFLSGFDS